MVHQRAFNPLFAVTAAATVVLAVGIAIAARPGAVQIPGDAPRPAAPSGRLSAEGLAVYHASERGAAGALSLMAQGLQIYQQSERNTVALGVPGLSAEGLALYQQSERGGAAAPAVRLNPEGLSIYHASEWGGSAPSNQDAGLATYHQSEWGRMTDRAQQFNAYQRSEWLGADR